MIDVHEDLVAALAGRYEIERELGHGGMATVFLARDVRHDRHVALKVLRADLTSSLGAERFVREINIAARLSHPHILALYDSGTAANTLYCVMPHVAGETLRQRLDREHQLPLDEAMAITRQIASALDYAHAQGVIHRDIKPENVLLLDEHVLVADFGLARALYSAASTRLTGSAVAVGTPAYMSPEQAAADPQVDGRTDLYSLACVLFEMVTGSPPFHGATVQALMMHHLNSPPPSICAQRTACPPWVDEAVQRALSKMPADRFRTAAQFVRALEGQSPGTTPVAGGTAVASPVVRQGPDWWRRGLAATAAIVLAGAGFLGWYSTRVSGAVASVDDRRYFVSPVERRGAAPPELAALTAQRVHDALSEWRGVSSILGPALPATGVGDERPPSVDSGLAAARAAAARWLVWSDVGLDGDSVTVHLSLHDARDGSRQRGWTVRHAATGMVARSLFREGVSALLRSRRELPADVGGERWTPSLAAWAAYDRARELLVPWDLEGAERALMDAVAADPDHAQAQLWLAQLRTWQLRSAADIGTPARRALELRMRLHPLDGAVATAQLHLAERRMVEACEAYREVVRQDSSDFRGWLGLGDCQSRDTIVLRDPRSPSRYRFRTSQHAAWQAYLRALERMPAPRPEFAYTRVSRLLFTEANRYRVGRSAAGLPASFAAYPALNADTLAFVPYEFALLTGSRTGVPTPTRSAAVHRNRVALRDLYLQWVRESPNNVQAHRTLGELLELMEEIRPDADGMPSAIEELATARRLLAQSPERLELGRATVRLLVKSEDWAGAAALSDSLVTRWPAPQGPAIAALIGPAALTGRVALTSRLLAVQSPTDSFAYALPRGSPWSLSPQIRREGAAMLAHAALGACTDSLRSFPTRLSRMLESYHADPAERREVVGLLARSHLILAAPCQGASPLVGIEARDPWVRMGQAVARNAPAEARRELQALMRVRSGARPGDVAIDATYFEAWVLTTTGDTSAAIAHLDRTLLALPTLGRYLLHLPEQTAGLVRAMGLRAELAAARGDGDTARRWSTAVATLWRKADPELQPYAARMNRLAAAP